MRIFEIMTSRVRTVAPSGNAEDAWQAMHKNGIRHLVVMDSSQVVGLLSEADLGGRSGGAVRAGAIVADLMAGDVVTVTPQETVRKVANVMRGRRIDCVPVVDCRRLVGVVTATDLLALLGRGVDRPLTPQRQAPHY
jgi:CBS domain-containing protein